MRNIIREGVRVREVDSGKLHRGNATFPSAEVWMRAWRRTSMSRHCRKSIDQFIKRDRIVPDTDACRVVNGVGNRRWRGNTDNLADTWQRVCA